LWAAFVEIVQNIVILGHILTGLGKSAGNLKKPMGMGKTGFYREKLVFTGKNGKNGKYCLFSKYIN
jgi:hypothetical protein